MNAGDVTRRRRHRRHWGTALSAATALSAILGMLLSGCREKTVQDTHITGIKLTVHYDPRLQISSLALSGTVGDAAAFTPGSLPKQPRPLTSGVETAVILLPATAAGKTVVLRVDGRAGAVVVGSDQQPVAIRPSVLAEVAMTLGAPAICGDNTIRVGIETCDDGNTASGDGCSSSCLSEGADRCNATSCPNGCCDGGLCRANGPDTCGVGGMACLTCDANADGCSAAGACTCGAAPACGAGLRCQAGACICDPGSCLGCCSAGKCLTGDTTAACGRGGQACETCSTGGCAGGRCDSCNATTCPSGCCSGATCYPRSVTTCGTGGAACTGCDPDKVDTCSVNGACRCGGKAPCGAGQRCMNGVCLCDADSCPTGCCSGDACNAPPSLTNCGMKGTACLPCDTTRADRCGPMGLCRCGGGPPCAGGQHCAGGQCICDASSCPSGCCDGAVCAVRSLLACGDAGSTCAVCDNRADNCSASGSCRCGTGSTCALGQRCIGSTCVCDGTSCPNGCCSGGACLPGDTASSCGAGGNACESCPTADVCTNGRCSGCNSVTCPDGCCSGPTCNVPSLTACGRAGSACVGCDIEKADGCSASGGCSCGTGPACTTGLKCLGGHCSCDAASCPSGCCDSSGACVAPSITKCGAAGVACVACDPRLTDHCTDAGMCACGAGTACAAGQRCLAGSCVCDATSCPGGCCSGATCRAPALTSCGPAGGACLACGVTADRCSAGDCMCGSGAACESSQHCVAGACICDQTSCANGCCSGSTCLPGTASASCGSGGANCQDCLGEMCSGGACGNCTAATCANGCCSGPTCTTTGSATACGSGGAACVTCDVSRADNCAITGECRCGATAACGGGTTCVGGACTCTPQSCPSGCCSGATCTTPTLSACGSGGQACVTCDARSTDQCDAVTGSCRCGTGPACGAGTSCVGGSCLCDAASCPAGCCAGATCVARSVSTCGASGGTCVACNPMTADSCGPAGACRCGASLACLAGRRCDAGVCVCDAISCPMGCCGPNGACLPGNKDLACGTGGVACQACPGASNCKQRVCM